MIVKDFELIALPIVLDIHCILPTIIGRDAFLEPEIDIVSSGLLPPSIM